MRQVEWLRNSLKHRRKELLSHANRCEKAYTDPDAQMYEPSKYLASVYREAADVFLVALDSVNLAEANEGE